MPGILRFDSTKTCSRRDFVRVGAFAFLPSARIEPDLVLTHANVITVDDGNWVYEA